MKTISRKEFIEQVGVGAAILFVASCAGSCKKSSSNSPSNVNFTVDVSTGQLASNGGYIIQNGVIVARTSTGSYIAVSATCTHAGGTLSFSSSDVFNCPLHGAQFNTSGVVVRGPASTNLTKYNTSLSGSSLRVYS